MVFRAGLSDPCTWDVARFLESVKIHSPAARVYAFRLRLIFTLSENLATSRVHGSRNPARNTIQ